ncbi:MULTISPECIES: DUF5996 family protein [unclassified Nocardioides]|uniref:DUF5996 family protein n=1 Tax=Nocardioides sp. URHA0032 TaxID=1380388 RepID=UPI0005607FF9|nr:DUF5996 family protein [Nocardioides sp. URHA0032]
MDRRASGPASEQLRYEWPALPVRSWESTRDTLHLWTQMVGKTRLALTPLLNHWWNVPLYVNSVGLTTSLMPVGSHDSLEVTFDFVAHQLVLRTVSGGVRALPLAPRTVADFYGDYLQCLVDLDVGVELNPMPTEIPAAVPFPADTAHHSYDSSAVNAFWRSLTSAHRVLTQFRAEFAGKASPVHFFWGAFDLAVTRFSGRPAPPHPGGVPHCPDWVMREAYRSEVSSCGYWPGGAEEGVFYAYAYPEPDGYRDQRPRHEASYYDQELREFVLPYEVVRQADDPDGILLEFLRDTHAFASAQWPPAADIS